MDKYLAELIGIIIGDGFLDSCQNHYRIGIVGDPIKDRKYFDYVQALIKQVWKKEVTIRKNGRGIRLVVNSKQAFFRLTLQYGLPVGEGKSYRVIIPQEIFKNWNLAKNAIRDIADTDGSIFVANKPGSPNYPSIELNTNSPELAKQLKTLLSEHGFRVANIWSYQSLNNSGKSFKVALNGHKNVCNWMKEIGFSNPVKKEKAERIISARSASGLLKGRRLSA